MKLIALTAALFTSFGAYARLNTVDFTCSEVREMIKDNGTFILSHGDQSLYSRFVSNELRCNSGEKALTAYAITLDKEKCNVGYVCGDRDSTGSFIAPSKITVCREGARQAFTVHDNNSDHSRTEIRTCENGRWYPKAPAPTIIKCKEGKYTSGKEYLYGEGHFNVTRQCQSGKWVIVRKTPTSDR